MKKFNERMIVRNGKMIYAISLSDKSSKSSNERTHILIESGEIHFSNNWYSDTIDFNFNDEAHKIAKEIFVSQLQVDIKRRILELKQLEEIFNSIGLSECLGNSIYDNTKKMLEMKKDIEKELKEVKDSIETKTKEVIDNTVKSIARKKPKKV